MIKISYFCIKLIKFDQKLANIHSFRYILIKHFIAIGLPNDPSTLVYLVYLSQKQKREFERKKLAEPYAKIERKFVKST